MIIYRVINIVNGKKYIGQTTGKLEQRKTSHFNESKKDTTIYFHNALKKYGKKNFKWEIIYECDDKLILNVMETMKIIVEHSHKSEGGYNLTWGGEGSYGYKHSDETKKKISESHKNISNETRIKMSESHKNIKKSDSTKRKMGEAKRKMTDETKTKIGIFNKGKMMSEITRKKIGLSNIGKKMSEMSKKKMSEAKKGTKHSDETKSKMSESHMGKVLSDYTKTKMSRSHKGLAQKYSNEIIKNAILLKTSGVSYSKISNDLCVPISTIQYWIRCK